MTYPLLFLTYVVAILRLVPMTQGEFLEDQYIQRRMIKIVKLSYKLEIPLKLFLI